MAVLKDGDFELDGYLFSGSRRQALFVQAVQVVPGKKRVHDVLNPVGDDILFGRDRRTAPEWRWAIRVGHGDPGVTLAALGRLASAWDSLPTDPGRESVLRYAVAGRTRRVYGRARELEPEVTQVYDLGRVVSNASFQARDPWYYDDVAQAVTVGLVPVSSGGLQSPLRSPLTTVAGAQRQGLITVGGNAPAPVEITFRGPISNPVVSSTGWSVGLTGSLAYDQSVTINTRTGEVTRNDGANLAGRLTRRTYLPDARLKPGAREIVFGGTDATGTATCTVQWRDTYRSY